MSCVGGAEMRATILDGANSLAVCDFIQLAN